MAWGKFKGREVAKLPRPYLEWLPKFLTEKGIHGQLEIEVYRALGRPAPPQPRVETLNEILDRVGGEVFKRFEAREAAEAEAKAKGWEMTASD